jgi:hypothetical protein
MVVIRGAAYSSLQDDAFTLARHRRVNMKSIHKPLLAALILGQFAVAAPAFAAGPVPVVRLETMTIVGKRPAPAKVAAAPAKNSASAAVPPVAVLETMTIVGHRLATPPAAQFAHATDVRNSRSVPL